MKIKKRIGALALLLCLTTSVACTASDQKIAFDDYWKSNVLAPADGFYEKLEYKVSFDANENSTVSYAVNYTGTYVTELQYVQEDGAEYYDYTTKLNVEATYTYKGVSSAPQQDSVESRVRLYAKSLEPLYSEKTLCTASPLNASVATVADCFETFRYAVKTDYAAHTATVTKLDENMEAEKSGKTASFSLDDADKYSYIDNEQLLLSLRAFPDSTSSGTLLCYAPFSDAVQKLKVNFSTAESKDFSYRKNAEEEATKTTIKYRPVTIQINAKNSGATQTAWIASNLGAGKDNVYHNVMLRLESPVAYELGTIIYELQSASYQKA